MATFSFTSVRFSEPNLLLVRGTLEGLRAGDRDRFYVFEYSLQPYEGSRSNRLSAILVPSFNIVLGVPPKTKVSHDLQIPGVGASIRKDGDRVAALRDFVRLGVNPRIILRATFYENGFRSRGIRLEKDVTRLFR